MANGRPATGLAPSDISFRLVRIGKSGVDENTIWSSQVAQAEVGSSGIYFALYNGALLDDFNYFSVATYSGPVSLDTDNYSKRYYG